MRDRWRSWGAGLVAGVAVLFVFGLAPVQRARAYRTASDLPEYADSPRIRLWSARPTLLLYDRVPRGLSLADLHGALRRSFSTWSEPACSTLALDGGALTRQHASVGDGILTVEVLGSEWRARGYPSDVAATTEVVYGRMPGGEWVITDADLFINDLDFEWEVDGAMSTSEARDLQSVITHELGHVLGLLHPCEPGGVEGAPACSSDPAFQQASMYPLYLGPSQRELGEDDLAGLCALYPAEVCEGVTCGAAEACVDERGCIALCGGVECRDGTHCEASMCVPDEVVPECEIDADCERGTCIDGFCIRGELGDPCTDASDCMTGGCLAGACAPTCFEGMCTEGFECVETEGEPLCDPELGVFGEACEVANDCLSEICLDRNGSATCSRRCSDGRPCPEGLTCGVVEGEQVCRPRSSGGCSVVTEPRLDSGRVFWCMCGIAIFAVFIRRRRL